MKTLLLAAVLTAAGLAPGCIHHTVTVDKPIVVEAHIKVDLDVKMQKDFENMFDFDESKPAK
jgi:hypothetical protein